MFNSSNPSIWSRLVGCLLVVSIAANPVGAAGPRGNRTANSSNSRANRSPDLSASSVNFQLTRLADLTSPIPQGTGTFGVLGLPSFDGTQVLFKGNSADGMQTGVYRSELNAALTRVADQTAVYPLTQVEFDALMLQGSGKPALNFPLHFNAFRPFEAPVISGQEIVFSGSIQQLDAGLLTGLFRLTQNNPPERLVTTLFDTTPMNGPVLTNIARPSYDAGVLAFAAKSGTTFAIGAYRFDANGLVELANSATVMPGQTTTFDDFGFSSFGATAISGGAVAFVGRTLTAAPNVDGVYLSNNGTLSRVVDSTQRFPGTLTSFGQGFRSVAANPQQLCVLHDSKGVLRQSGTSLTPVVTFQTLIPGFAPLTFNDFTSFSVAGTQSVAVVAGFEYRGQFLSASIGRGLYLDEGQGPVCMVQAQNSITLDLPFLDSPISMAFGGDVLGSQTVADVTVAEASLSTTGVAVLVQFTDSAQAIFVAQP